MPAPETSASAMRIILVRHGQPHIGLRPSTGHAGFADYIGAYEEAGLSPANLPPAELKELVRELDHVFTSTSPRSRQSAAALAAEAAVTADVLFAEAPLAAPRIPLLRMTVPKWAVVSRILWHLGFSPRIETAREASRRAGRAADMLVKRAQEHGTAVLVAHGYFNWMIGRRLKARGFVRTGSHQARYWNTVIYEKKI